MISLSLSQRRDLHVHPMAAVVAAAAVVVRIILPGFSVVIMAFQWDGCAISRLTTSAVNGGNQEVQTINAAV